MLEEFLEASLEQPVAIIFCKDSSMDSSKKLILITQEIVFWLLKGHITIEDKLLQTQTPGPR